VDSIEVIEGNVIIKGFAFEVGKDAKEGMVEIVLQDVESKKIYFLETQYTERKDVNDYFLCDYNYLQSGFVASIKEKKLDLDEREYEIFIRMKGERTTYEMETFISNGELMYVNPTEFCELDVKGTDLEEVVEKGVLRVYRPDYEMYVYQYEGELYWIVGTEYEFDEGEDALIQYQMNTTQVNILNGTDKENRGFWFSKAEIRLIARRWGRGGAMHRRRLPRCRARHRRSHILPAYFGQSRSAVSGDQPHWARQTDRRRCQSRGWRAFFHAESER